MSQPFSRFLHPFDRKPHPSLEPEVRRAIIASLAPWHGSGGDAGALNRVARNTTNPVTRHERSGSGPALAWLWVDHR